MKKIIIAAVAVCALVATPVLGMQCTGGDKARKGKTSPQVASNRKSEPPDPLVARKSPGRNKRGRRHHRRTTRNSNGVKPNA